MDITKLVLCFSIAFGVTLISTPFVKMIAQKIGAIDVPDANHVVINGIDKQKVGQFAAEVRGKRPPEPYKGKGIRYVGEYVRRKEGKAGKGGKK